MVANHEMSILVDSNLVLTQRVREVALWCSLHELTPFHPDTPDEARRRRLLEEASGILANLTYKRNGWFRKLLADDGSYEKAMGLLREADPDTLASLEAQLRSPELRPPYSIGGSYCGESRQAIVDAVIERRSSVLKSLPWQNSSPAATEPVGRLLLYVPSENVSDGASRFVSKVFFDAFDCPPWDLWVFYSDRTLVSWVPEVLFSLAQAGIDANPVECIRWAD